MERHCPLAFSQVDVEASCKSEIMLHRQYNPSHPSKTKRSTARHLLHPISGMCMMTGLISNYHLTVYIYIIIMCVPVGWLAWLSNK